MANTYTQIYIQAVFSVQERGCVIRNSWKNELHSYITGIVQNNGHKLLAINGMPDHVHILFGMRPNQALSDLMMQVKRDSAKWINDNRLARGRFAWQEGYGAFSYSKSDVDAVIDYIRSQEQHHRQKSFIEEYNFFLRTFDVVFNERYTFTPIEYSSEDVD
jgi:putative transposase